VAGEIGTRLLSGFGLIPALTLILTTLSPNAIPNPKSKPNPNLSSQAAQGPEEVSFPELDEAIVRYQDPAEADNIVKIQQQIDETKDVLHNTIDNLLARGEKLDRLVERSDELSMQSKMFYRQARKTNSCCVIA